MLPWWRDTGCDFLILRPKFVINRDVTFDKNYMLQQIKESVVDIIDSGEEASKQAGGVWEQSYRRSIGEHLHWTSQWCSRFNFRWWYTARVTVQYCHRESMKADPSTKAIHLCRCGRLCSKCGRIYWDSKAFHLQWGYQFWWRYRIDCCYNWRDRISSQKSNMRVSEAAQGTENWYCG